MRPKENILFMRKALKKNSRRRKNRNFFYYMALCFVSAHVLYFCWVGAETCSKRQVMRHDCLPSLLGDGEN
jgi:hypothetical protein